MIVLRENGGLWPRKGGKFDVGRGKMEFKLGKKRKESGFSEIF